MKFFRQNTCKTRRGVLSLQRDSALIPCEQGKRRKRTLTYCTLFNLITLRNTEYCIYKNGDRCFTYCLKYRTNIPHIHIFPAPRFSFPDGFSRRFLPGEDFFAHTHIVYSHPADLFGRTADSTPLPRPARKGSAVPGKEGGKGGSILQKNSNLLTFKKNKTP